jgi:hypothetical protein
VLQQLAQCDRPAVRHQARQPPGDAVGEPEPALRDQLQHQRRDEGLGDAADPEPVVRGHRLCRGDVRQAGRDDGHPVATALQPDHAGHTITDDSLERRPERAAARGHLGAAFACAGPAASTESSTADAAMPEISLRLFVPATALPIAAPHLPNVELFLYI